MGIVNTISHKLVSSGPGAGNGTVWATHGASLSLQECISSGEKKKKNLKQIWPNIEI